ncbi:MAG: T9SS type A sorting domain-containing protein, partial [Candidatus Eisenbacteria bacterium]|nr:T9SS type A sorting domain-containing protein [Candidatus Eisenbacteria bacterium]
RAFPNPARRDIAVRYRLRGDAEVECELLDLRGRSVRGRICQSRSAGEHVIRLEVADLPSGIYSLRVTVAGRSRVGRIAVIR